MLEAALLAEQILMYTAGAPKERKTMLSGAPPAPAAIRADLRGKTYKQNPVGEGNLEH